MILAASKAESLIQAKISGFDYLRAFASVAVVAWHVGIFPVSDYTDKPGFHFSLVDFLNYYVILAAVPIFFLISVFLFASKERDFIYTKKRVGKLLTLLVFWSYIFQRPDIISGIDLKPTHLASWFISGGGTLYYFFFSLAIITILTFLIRKLKNGYLVLLFLIFCIPLGLMNYIQQYWNIKLCYFYNPLNFLPYAPLGILTVRYWRLIQKKQKLVVTILLIVLIPVILIEYGTLSHFTHLAWTWRYTPTEYTRPSLPLLSLLYVVLVANIRAIPGWIKYMSSRSLGLYVTQIFVMDTISFIVEKVSFKIEQLIHIKIWTGLFTTILVVGVCYLIIDNLLRKIINNLVE